MTAGGLFGNVEAACVIDLDLALIEDRKVLESAKEYYQDILNADDPNAKLLNKRILNSLVKSGLVPTEAERQERRMNQE